MKADAGALPAGLSPLAEQLAALFQKHAVLSLSQAAAELAASPHTLKRKFRELLDAGWISTHGKGRGEFYRRK